MTYLVQKISAHDVSKATDALNKQNKDGYKIIYATSDGGKLIVIFEKRVGRPPKKK